MMTTYLKLGASSLGMWGVMNQDGRKEGSSVLVTELYCSHGLHGWYMEQGTMPMVDGNDQYL